MLRRTILYLILGLITGSGNLQGSEKERTSDDINLFRIRSDTMYLHKGQRITGMLLAWNGPPVPQAMANTKPTAHYTIEPATGVTGTVFTFDPTGSRDSESSLAWLSVRFDWENDGTYDTSWWNASQTLENTFTTVGTRTIAMLVQDPEGLKDVTTRILQVGDPGGNTPPTARCSVNPAGGPIQTTFLYSASTSSDRQDASATLMARWDWHDSGYWSTPWEPISKSQQHQFDRHGSKTVRLRVRDSGMLSHDTTCTVEVTPEQPNTAPVAHFLVTPAEGNVYTEFAFDAGGSSDAEDGIAWLSVRYDWEDDGNYDTSWWNASQLYRRRFQTPGLYTIRMEIKDTGNKTATTTRSLQVKAAPIYLPHVERE